MTPETLTAEGALLALRKIKQMLIDRTPYLQVVAITQTEIRELENLLRTGERRPGNALEVRG